MNIQQLREAVTLLGGQTAAAKQMGLKGPDHVQRVLAGRKPMPRRWTYRVTDALNKHSKETARLALRITLERL